MPEQKDQKGHIIVVLDESGSMSCQRNDIIGGMNEMLRQQREIHANNNSDIMFTIVKFSNNVKPEINNTLKDMKINVRAVFQIEDRVYFSTCNGYIGCVNEDGTVKEIA